MTAPLSAPLDGVGDDPSSILALRGDPPRAGRLAARARAAKSGHQAWIVECRAADPVEAASTSWPDPAAWPERDVVVAVTPERAEAYVSWLLAVARATPATHDPMRTLAPWCATPAGTHRLWLIAAARIVLPASIRVMARHDLIGIRMAQLALAFGADALGGPVAADRKLPLAGVTRPNENTRTGLAALIEQAGLSPLHRETP